MNNDNEMLEEAIAALSNGTQAMQGRLREVQVRLDEVKRRRAHVLRAEVERLLPAFSARILAGLETEMQAFAGTAVRAVFSQHRKTFGLFKSHGYDSALSTMQARLASHIEQTRPGDFAKLDTEIMTLEAERSRLDLRLHETTLNLTTMTSALNGKGRIGAEARTQLANIVERSRRSASSAPGGVSRFSAYSQKGKANRPDDRTDYDTSSDADLWFYAVTDIPASFRMWMLGSLQQHTLTAADDSGQDDQGNTERVEGAGTTSSGSHAGIAAMAASVGLDAIATDDRLGAFS